MFCLPAMHLVMAPVLELRFSRSNIFVCQNIVDRPLPAPVFMCLSVAILITNPDKPMRVAIKATKALQRKKCTKHFNNGAELFQQTPGPNLIFP